MGSCSHCGTKFPKTRATRKYCSDRCKTNACLERKPRRIRAAELEALHELLHTELPSADAFRERLRSILAPELPPTAPLVDGRAVVPRLD